MFETNVFGVVAVTNAFLPLLRAADAARVVNLSSEVGSLSAMLDDTDSPMYQFLKELPYATSKTALNMVTGQFARELATPRSRSAPRSPVMLATDLSDNTGQRTPAQTAEIIATLASLPADAPTGQYWGSLTGAPDGVHESGRW